MSYPFVGNSRTRETHYESCYCVSLMNEDNKIRFHSLKEAMQRGFDTCGHCLESRSVKAEKRSSSDYQYVGRFCLLSNGREICNTGSSGIADRIPRKVITLIGGIRTPEGSPVTGEPVRFTVFPFDSEEVLIREVQTDANGVAKVDYDCSELEQGVTRFRAHFSAEAWFDESSTGMYMDLMIDFLPVVTNIRVDPKSFPNSTTIYFDLLEDSEIDIGIYRNTHFLRPLSRRKTIRSEKDGVMKKGKDRKVVWDGKNDRGRPVWRGSYVVALETAKDFVYNTDLYKSKGKL